MVYPHEFARERLPCSWFNMNGSLCLLHVGKGRHGSFLADISKFYLEYHQSTYNKDLVYLHDPCALVAAVRPELFEWKTGAVVIGQDGPLRGKTVLDGTETYLDSIRWQVHSFCKWIGLISWNADRMSTFHYLMNKVARPPTPTPVSDESLSEIGHVPSFCVVV
jgi:hypothetical protein